MLKSKINIYVNTYVLLDKSNASYSATLKVSFYDVSHLDIK